MARSSREETEATRARVLEAAHELFAERGYAAVGLEEVALAAGVTRGAVYHHYGSKRGLFAAVHGRAQEAVGAAIEAATGSFTDPWEMLEVGCRAFLEAAIAPEVRQVLLVDAPAVLGWDVWREQDAAHSARMLGEVLTELRRAGVLADLPPAAVAAVLSGAMNEAALGAASLPDPGRGVDDALQVLQPMVRALRR